MQRKKLLIIGISLTLAAALPAMAVQSGGGAGQRGGSMPSSQMQRGTMQQDRLKDQDQLRDRNQIYGSQLMTSAERRSYRNQMRSLKTAQEREALRKQHHEQMQKRAAERGMTLPDMPLRNGAGMGPGAGMGRGAGMGPGAGMQQRMQNQTDNQIYGSQLMTPAERRSYRNQMRSQKTAQEREELRKQHHEQMQKRAAERGMTLPDMPRGNGAGMGPGAGMRQQTQQQTEQQQQNQGKEQQIKQKQSTEQQIQQQKDDGNR